MDEDVQLPPKLFSRFSYFAEVLERHSRVTIISHYDADGISAAGIIAAILLRKGKEIHVRLFKALNHQGLESIMKMESECTVLADMGAAYIKEILASDKDMIVLDHHQTDEEVDNAAYINPHNFGIDGMRSACAGSLAMMLAAQNGERNWDLVQLAFAGIAGDRQHINGLSGVNEYLLQEGVRRGHIKVLGGSLVPSGELRSSLYLCTDPYISGVSGDMDGVESLLREAGVPEGVRDSDLDSQTLRRLSSLIALRLLAQGVSLSTIQEAARERYHLCSWGIDAECLASLLNACGRKDREGLGIAVTLGDENARQEAEALEREYKEELVSSVRSLEKEGFKRLNNIQYFYSPSTGYTGIICGIAMQYLGDSSLPCFGLSRKENTVRISGRSTNEQLVAGIDLASALRDASAAVGGSGGGHRIASGAAVPLEKEAEFLKELDRIIGEQRAST